MPSTKRAKPAASQGSARGANNSKRRKTDAASTSADGKRVVTKYEDEDEEDDNEEDGIGEIKRGAKRALEALEGELGTAKGLLRRNAKILSCNAEFEDGEEPRTAEVLARIHSPEKNGKYIEIHFSYHSRSRMNSIEWFYTIGYKIFSSVPASATSLKTFRGRSHASTYDRQGWRSIAYAFYNDNNTNGRRWRRIEVFSVDATNKGLLEAHKALWGPLKALPSRVGSHIQGAAASVGIDYTIACEDGEADVHPGGYGLPRRQRVGWVLEGAGDRWLARGARRTCGFQLERDPADELKGKQDREEEANGVDEDEYDSEKEDDGSEEYEY
ncbi:hypothetical protein BD779DRAFT_1469440 [Infundibulicybe gibba]|nr:hypothetical protein BD779DRAFT_1469440 [Infundibulicybe gibba]